MNIKGIETQYQNYAASGTSRTKSSSRESTVDSFQKEIVNWGKRIKEAMDKERENDSNGSIQMSEKQWRNLMEKVDNVLAATKKEQEQEEAKQLEEKNLIRKNTVAASFQTQPNLVQTVGYTDFLLPAREKRDQEG